MLYRHPVPETLREGPPFFFVQNSSCLRLIVLLYQSRFFDDPLIVAFALAESREKPANTLDKSTDATVNKKVFKTSAI